MYTLIRNIYTQISAQLVHVIDAFSREYSVKPVDQWKHLKLDAETGCDSRFALKERKQGNSWKDKKTLDAHGNTKSKSSMHSHGSVQSQKIGSGSNSKRASDISQQRLDAYIARTQEQQKNQHL